MSPLPSSASGATRQRILLGVLGLALAVAAWFYYAPAATSPASSQTRAVPSKTDSGELPVPETVHLTALAEPSELKDADRNPFSYGVRPPPPAPPRPPAPSIPQPVMNPGPPPVVGPPPIGLRLVGLTTITTGGRPMVTLKDPATSAVFNAFEGDIVDGRYRVIKVGLQSVTLSYVDGSGTKLLSLGG